MRSKLMAATAAAVLLAQLAAFGLQKSGAGYVLPFPNGKSFKLLQGNNGPWGHAGHAAFAYDFQMPVGGDVTAARAGEVVKIEEGFSDGTKRPGEENYVVIKQADGTFARYYHLTKDGALVAVGDKVAQGDKIGLSGNSGASAGAHLHFDVTEKCFEWGCQTIRVDFANARENPLKQGEVYEALR
ncbi:MAG TPA: M23 family metallopeptidase [Pyrinomonadaceae bacterium]|nr:M23 family metallopeptidase [Pyrinomonadaceae bacterium]